MRILVVDDEKLLVKGMKFNLEHEGYQVECAYDGAAAVELARDGRFDLLILDVMMPGLNGFQLARLLRAEHISTPILMLTARSDTGDRVTGLEAGADYYLPKPFDTRELLACIHALLRRQGSQVNELTVGNTSLDLESACLLCGENTVRLSAKEFEILRHLFQSREKNVSKEFLLCKVWGYDSEAVENNVEVYIGFLRKKLRSIGSDVRIEVIRRLGYHLETGP